MSEPSKPEPRRPSKEFALAAIALAKQRWNTNAEILRAMGYKKADPKNETLRRLARGEGSDTAGSALLRALKEASIDTTKLPPMYPDEDGEQATESWREDWATIGDLLHEHAPKIFQRHFDELLPLARAIARQIGAEVDLGRAT